MNFKEKLFSKRIISAFCLIFVAAVFLPSCSSTAFGPKLKLKYSFKTFPMDVTSGVMKTSANGNYSAKYEFTLANFDLNSDGAMTKTITDPKEIRLYFYLHGLKGTTQNTLLKTGTYPVGMSKDAAGYFGDFTFFVVEEGKQTIISSQESAAVDKSGQLKVTSVSGDTVKGEIDISTKKGYSVSGRFTAKIK